jgi:NAD-reducing hydrogenase small subunit
LHRAYLEAAKLNPCVPEAGGIVPPLLERVVPVHEMIHVDHFLPGCPPSAARIRLFLTQWLEGKEPRLAGPDIKFG